MNCMVQGQKLYMKMYRSCANLPAAITKTVLNSVKQNNSLAFVSKQDRSDDLNEQSFIQYTAVTMTVVAVWTHYLIGR